MSVLLQQEYGVKLRDARSTMQDLVTARKIEVVKYQKESGTVQNDTELTQAVDRWIAHLEVEDQKRKDSKKTSDILAKVAKEASVHRMIMMTMWSRKRKLSVESGEEGSADDVSSEQADDLEGEQVATMMRAKRRKGMKKSGQGTSSMAPDGNVQAIVAGMTMLGDKMIQAIATQPPDTRIEQLQAGQTEIMAMLQEMRNERS